MNILKMHGYQLLMILSGNIIFSSEEQYEKVFSSIFATQLGIVMFGSGEQYEKADSPIHFIEFGIVMYVQWILQNEKAFLPISYF